MAIRPEFEDTAGERLYDTLMELPITVSESELPGLYLNPGETFPGFTPTNGIKTSQSGKSNGMPDRGGEIPGYFSVEEGGQYPQVIVVRPESIIKRGLAMIRGKEANFQVDLRPPKADLKRKQLI